MGETPRFRMLQFLGMEFGSSAPAPKCKKKLVNAKKLTRSRTCRSMSKGIGREKG